MGELREGMRGRLGKGGWGRIEETDREMERRREGENVCARDSACLLACMRARARAFTCVCARMCVCACVVSLIIY